MVDISSLKFKNFFLDLLKIPHPSLRHAKQFMVLTSYTVFLSYAELKIYDQLMF